MTITRYLKLTLLLMIGIACLVALAGIWIRDRIHADIHANLQRQVAMTEQLGRVGSTVLTALNAENRFLLRYPVEGVRFTQVHRREAHAAVQETRKALKKIVEINRTAGVSPTNRLREHLEGQLSLFEVELKRVVRLITQKGDASSGLVGEMKRMAAGLDNYLGQLQRESERYPDAVVRRKAIQSVSSHMLSLRSWEKDYLLWNNRDTLVPAARQVARLVRDLADGPFSPREQTRILTYLRTYMIYFERMALNSVQLFTELDRTGVIADQLRDTLGLYDTAERDWIRHSELLAEQRRHRMSMGLFAFLIILIVIATALAVRLTHRITSRLKVLTDATQQLGERGDVPPIILQTRDEFALLADTFNSMVAKLRDAQLQLVQGEKLAATGKLSASIAHEINNPLFGIQGCLERILKRIPKDDSDHRLVSLAMSESQRIARLVSGLRNFHRPSDQTMALVDLLGVLDDVFLINGKYLQQAKVTLNLILPGTLPQIRGTRDQLQMVFVNLVTNAVEAMPNGGTLTVEARHEPDAVLLRFSDTGKGISPSALPKLFEPFFSTKPEVKGVGLGLSISYGIVKRHGGEIRVSSEPGNTNFVVVLPLIDGHGAPATDDA